MQIGATSSNLSAEEVEEAAVAAEVVAAAVTPYHCPCRYPGVRAAGEKATYMTPVNFADAPQQLRGFMLSQAERRLADQNSFAAAADARAATITGASAALATASAGLLGVALTGSINIPMAAGSIAGVLGFARAAYHAIQSAKCAEFHPAGLYPSNFEEDIRGKKRRPEIEGELLADLEVRLAFNRDILIDRGRIIEQAMKRLWTTPLYALLTVVLAWLAQQALPSA